MLKSMTAYGRATLHHEMGHFTVEIQSVNRKFLEINVLLPRELSHFDVEIKKWLQPHLSRGQVSVKVSAFFDGQSPFIINPNLALAKQLKEAWRQIAAHLELDEQEIDLTFFAKEDNLLRYEENRQEEDTYCQLIKQVFEEALAGFMQMKRQEGVVLQADTLERTQKIKQSIALIEQRAPYATERYREKLIARLNEIVPGHIENEERVIREVAVFAEKIDIAEEITRFNSHLNHFEELIQNSESSVGKTLEFVLQELGREINTIGSKSSDLLIARAVIDIKSELERIREQMQNIE